MLLSGAEILIKSLIDEGVDTVFGFPGGAVLNIYDALFKYRDSIKHILTCHEQGAAHAADGYSRATGKVGVCIATSGPGATNLVTGIATAYMDSIPLVAITGNVPKALLGKDSFQEIDITGITMSITKHSYIVQDINELQSVINRAFYIAKEGRPGPVLIDIPKDITQEKTKYHNMFPLEVKRNNKNITKDKLIDISNLINTSHRPLIYAGGGVKISEATNELIAFAEKINAPIATTLMGTGVVPYDHAFYTGMMGMHGTKASNILVTECDLIITLGARFSDRGINNQKHIENAKIIQIDVDPAEVNKNIKVDDSMIGDIKEVLTQLTPLIQSKENKQWIERLIELKNIDESNKNNISYITPKDLFNKLNELNDGNFIITTEVGQHQMWAAQNIKCKDPRCFISSGGLGTMGFGLGAAIGAKISCFDKIVINIAGDGSFGMNCNEFATAVKYNIPIIVIVFNNNSLGMVRQWQDLFYNKRFSETTLNRETDFVKLAEAFGGRGYRIASKKELDSVLKEAIEINEPVIIDFVISNNEKVFPMVAPGAPINEIIME